MRMSTPNYDPKTLKTYKGLRLSLVGNVLLFFFLFPYMLFALEGEYYEQLYYLFQILEEDLCFSVFCLLLPAIVIISLVGSYFTHKGKEEFTQAHTLYLGYSLRFGIIGTVAFFLSFLSILAPLTEFQPERVFILAIVAAIPLWKTSKCLALYNLVGKTGKYFLFTSFALSLVFSIWLVTLVFARSYYSESAPIGSVLTALFLYLGSYFTYLATLINALQSIKSGEVKPSFAELEEEEWFYRAHTQDEERSLQRHYQPYQPGQEAQKTNYVYRMKLEERKLARETPGGDAAQTPEPVLASQEAVSEEQGPGREIVAKVAPTEQKKPQQSSSSDVLRYWED